MDYQIYDTTLRDGEQMSGVVFSFEQKVELAKRFYDFGVDLIDLMPAVSKIEQDVARKLVSEGLENKIIAATMLRKEHISLAKKLGFTKIILFTPLSDLHLKEKLRISHKENYERVLGGVNYAKDLGLDIYFAGEDATRADKNYIFDFVKGVEDKINFFMPCDTLGYLTPFQTYDFIKEMVKNFKVDIGLHIHNDFGCATANTLAGIEAGAKIFSGTFTGIGERAGNTALEEVIIASKYQYQREFSVKYEQLNDICNLVQNYSNITVQNHKPLIGKNAFCHESGIHVDGVLKNPFNYEPINPEEIGIKRKFSFGKHSGLAGLRYLFGNKFNEVEYQEILDKIKYLSSELGKSFSEEEVKKMFD